MNKERFCRVCNIHLVIGQNHSATDNKYSIYLCSTCKSKKHKDYIENTDYNKVKRTENKEIFLNHYGNICACCGENGWQFLTLDHKNNDPDKDIKRLGINNFYRFKDKEDLSRFQILCMNCNYSKGHNGFCPHILKNEESCSLCNIELRDNILDKICNQCLLSNSVSKKPNAENKLRNKTNTIQIKEKIVENYGGKCACCGENELLFLTIEHKNLGGRKENKELKRFGKDFYQYLINNNYPKEPYELLCYNCNCCKFAFGSCYHKTNISIKEYINRE